SLTGPPGPRETCPSHRQNAVPEVRSQESKPESSRREATRVGSRVPEAPPRSSNSVHRPFRKPRSPAYPPPASRGKERTRNYSPCPDPPLHSPAPSTGSNPMQATPETCTES